MKQAQVIYQEIRESGKETQLAKLAKHIAWRGACKWNSWEDNRGLVIRWDFSDESFLTYREREGFQVNV